MEAFNSIIGAVGKVAGPLGEVTKAVTPFTSLAGMINQYSLAGKEKALMDRQVYYAKHPEVINSLVKQYQQPLSQGLVKGTENIVNASLAEQGLSQAPGIQAQVLAQALAPYQQNEQQMAITEAFKALGLPADALASITGATRPNELAMMLKSILPQQSPTPIPAQQPTGTISDTGLTPPIFGSDPSQSGVPA